MQRPSRGRPPLLVRAAAGFAALVAATALATALVATAPTATGPAWAAAGTGDAEQVIAQLLAAERDRAGVGAAPRSSQLDAVARDWAHQQAADDQMKHNPALRDQVQPARAWYENVGTYSGVPSAIGYGDAGRALHELWMGSDGHRANILRGGITDVGIGVAATGDRIYATVVFRDHGGQVSQPAPEPPPPAPEPAEAQARASSAAPAGPAEEAPAEPPPAREPEPVAPAEEPTPDPTPAPTPSEPTIEVAVALDRSSGVDADQPPAELPADLPAAAPTEQPVEELRDDDVVVALDVREQGPAPLPLLLGGATVVGAAALAVARARRPAAGAARGGRDGR